jgi:ferrochelatase
MSQPADSNTAILLLAHGTPNVLGEMAEYLSKVTSGRPLPPQVVAELQHRYAQIGLGETPSAQPPPLTRWTLQQSRLLEAALAAAGTPLPVYAAMRNWHPFIPDVVRQMLADGVANILALCLAPQNSSTSTGLYRRALVAALDAEATHNPSAAKPALTFIDAWSDEPALIAAFTQRLVDLYPDACKKSAAALPVLFTAHSVPTHTVVASESNPTPDPYPVEAKRTAELVFQSAARKLPSLKSWFFAFQSQGVAGGPWIGPTVEDTLADLAAAGHSAVVLQPIGFLSDHVEILYDIDIAFAETAHNLGLRLFRPESLNDSPLLTEALVNVVQTHLHEASQPTNN